MVGHKVEGALALTLATGKGCGMAVRKLHRARICEPSNFSKCDSSVEKYLKVEAINER